MSPCGSTAVSLAALDGTAAVPAAARQALRHRATTQPRGHLTVAVHAAPWAGMAFLRLFTHMLPDLCRSFKRRDFGAPGGGGCTWEVDTRESRA